MTECWQLSERRLKEARKSAEDHTSRHGVAYKHHLRELLREHDRLTAAMAEKGAEIARLRNALAASIEATKGNLAEIERLNEQLRTMRIMMTHEASKSIVITN